MRLRRTLLALSIVLPLAAAAAGPAAAQADATTPPHVLEHVDPVYPPAKLADGIDTTVILLITVEKDGSVSEATVAESGGAEFDEAALAAARRWRFSPASRGGAPIRARIRVPFHFAPGPHETPHVEPAGAGGADQREGGAPPGPPAAGQEERPEPPPPPPAELSQGVIGPHSVSEPGKPIEIHVQGRPNPPSRSPSDFRIGRDVLGAAPRSSAADLLSAAPGVYVAQPEGDAVAQRIFLRGFDAEHGQDVELRVGPVPLNQRSHIHGQGYADLNVIIPEVVRSLRVVEGVYDPDQGDFAVAGSAHFDLGVEERGLLFQGALGSFGARRLLAIWAPEGQPEDTFGAATVRATDGFGDAPRGAVSGGAIGQMRIELPDDYSALLHVAAYAGRAGVAGVLRRDDVLAGRVGFLDAYPDPTARSQSAAASRAQLALTVDRTDDDGSQKSAALWAALSGFRSRLNFTGYTQRSRENPDWIGRGDLFEQSNDDLSFGARFGYRTRRYKPLRWLTGQLAVSGELQTSRIEQAQSLLAVPQNETWDRRVDAELALTSAGAHVDGLLAAGRFARLRGGFRSDVLLFDIDNRLGNRVPANREETHIEGFRRTAAGVAWGPRATLEVDPLPWLRVSASYGRGFRSPQADLLEEGESAPYTTVHSFEGGATLRAASASATFAAYETHLSDDVAFNPVTARFERTGPTTRRGLVAYLLGRPAPWLTAAASVTFVHATLDGPPPATPDNPTPSYVEGQQLPNVPPVVVRTDLSATPAIAQILGEPLTLRVGLGTTFLSSRPLQYAQYAKPVFLADASLSLRRTFLELGVEAQNLLDARYADVEYAFASNWAQDPQDRIPSALPARHFAAGPPLTVLGSVTLHL